MSVQPYATLHWFNNRLRQLFPEREGIVSLTTKQEIRAVLETVLQAPLVYNSETDGLPGDVLWWFRGRDSNYIIDYTLSADNVLALHMVGYQRHMKVVRVDVALSDVPDMNFLHLICDPLPSKSAPEPEEDPTNVWDVAYYVPAFGRTMQYEEFNHDAPYAEEAITLYFHTARYNVFIAPKESRLNMRGDNSLIFKELCNMLLKGETELAIFVEALSHCPPSGYTQYLIRELNQAQNDIQ